MKRTRLARTTIIGMLAAAGVTATFASPPAPDNHPKSKLDAPAAPPARLLHGIVAPARKVTLSAPIDGQLMQVAVREGQVVEAGGALLVMDDRVARASVAVARLQAESEGPLDQARAALDHARSEFERVERMRGSDAASDHELVTTRHELEQARAAVRTARETLAVARAMLELQEQLLERHTLRAPFAGVVVRVHARAGQMLETSDAVLELVALDTLEAELHLPLGLFGRLEVGREYELEAAAPVNETLTGLLRTVDPMIDPASGTFRCVFDVANAGTKLPAGFAVTLAEHEVSRIARR